MTRNREKKLKPAIQLAQELASFRDRLLSYGHDHSRVVSWLEDAIKRINSQLHNRLWPPIWWRYGRIDAEASWLAHSFNRADSEGFFYAQTDSGYLAERDEILSVMQSIYKSYKVARH